MTVHPAARPATRSDAARALSYALATARSFLTDVMFVFLTVVLPIVMYLIFSGIYGEQNAGGGVLVKAAMMVTMAAYGGLGAAMNLGFFGQEENRNGWIRQLTLTGLAPAWMVGVRAVVASLLIVPAIVPLFVVAVVGKGVDLPLSQHVGAAAILWVTLIPMILLGMAFAYWLPGSGGQAATTITLMVLSIVGGLWFPVSFFPAWLQDLALLTPSYWIGRLGLLPLTGDDLPWRGVLTLLVWTLVLVVVCTLGYRRSVSTTRR